LQTSVIADVTLTTCPDPLSQHQTRSTVSDSREQNTAIRKKNSWTVDLSYGMHLYTHTREREREVDFQRMQWFL